jgi:uroporphyrinogen-III synthase
MPALQGRRVALLESRKIDELSVLVRRLGGTVVAAPTVREVPRLEDAGIFVDGLAARRFGVTIFLTGVGATTLFAEADRQGRLPQTLDALSQTIIACRGPKPLAVMKRHGLIARLVTVKPHTTRELLDALTTVDLQGTSVLLVHYGERNNGLADALRAMGARLDEVCSYEWALPENLAPIVSVIREAIDGRLDVMLFTSQVQCRHLFQVARDLGLADALTTSMNGDLLVGAVGPVCADSLREFGITPDVIPSAPNMASLIAAVGDYFELTGQEGTQGTE